jgi:hypothetical protein
MGGRPEARRRISTNHRSRRMCARDSRRLRCHRRRASAAAGCRLPRRLMGRGDRLQSSAAPTGGRQQHPAPRAEGMAEREALAQKAARKSVPDGRQVPSKHDPRRPHARLLDLLRRKIERQRRSTRRRRHRLRRRPSETMKRGSAEGGLPVPWNRHPARPPRLCLRNGGFIGPLTYAPITKDRCCQHLGSSTRRNDRPNTMRFRRAPTRAPPHLASRSIPSLRCGHTGHTCARQKVRRGPIRDSPVLRRAAHFSRAIRGAQARMHHQSAWLPILEACSGGRRCPVRPYRDLHLCHGMHPKVARCMRRFNESFVCSEMTTQHRFGVIWTVDALCAARTSTL